MKTFNRIKRKRGFVILFAVTISAILLAIALGVANIALKEVKFSTSSRDTNDAFFAADTGIELALFNDKDPLSYPAGLSYGPFIVPGLGNTGQGCASFTVDKINPALTTVISKGYNMGGASCSSTNPNRIEREIKTTYGSAGPPPPATTCNGLIATIIGTSDGETLSNTNGNDVIVGNGGNDTINGSGGADTICAGSGDDIINGGNGNDTIFDTGGINNITGGSGDDDITSGSGNDTINGDGGTDTIYDAGGNNNILGGGGDDNITTGSGNDTINGNTGIDTCSPDGGSDMVNCEVNG